MKRRIIVTGLTGRTGYYFLQRLKTEWPRLSDGMELAAIVRESSDVSAILESGLPIRLAVAELTDEAALTAAMAGGDTLLHIAGIHWSEPVFAAAVSAGIHRIIAVHTTGIYSKYKSAGEDYRRIDAACEKMAAGANIDLTLLRPTMIYGDLDDQNVSVFIRMVDTLPVIPVVSGGRYPLQPVHRKDLGNAYFAVLTRPEVTRGKRYVLSGEKPILLRDMLEKIAICLGRTPRFMSCPYWLAITGAWAVFLLTLGKIDLREKVMRLVEPRAYAHEAAAWDFGFAPMPFDEGIAGEVERYLENKKG